jgi:hypothetical protein
MEQIQLYKKIIHLPENLKSEVNDFVDFLLTRSKNLKSKKQPEFGCAKGMIFISQDFDEPLEDFKEYI